MIQKHPFIDYAEKNFKVHHPVKGMVAFEAHKFNIDLANIIDTERFILVKKYRQAGFSTFAALWAIYECMYKENQSIGIICKTDSDISRYLSWKIDKVLENMADDIYPQIVKRTDHHIQFKNGNAIWFLTPQACCSKSFNTIFLDEAAFWDNLESFWTAMLPTLYPNGKAIIGSTPNHKNYFYKLWTESNFYKYAPSVFDHPDYKTFEECKIHLGEKRWSIEFLAEFL